MKLDFQTLPTGSEGTVTLEGNLTVDRAEEMRMLFIKALIDADRVTVRIGKVTDVDLSCLQLLCSAHRSAARMNRHLVFDGDWPDPFRQAVLDAGYSRLTGCRLDKDNSCLWTRKLS